MQAQDAGNDRYEGSTQVIAYVSAEPEDVPAEEDEQNGDGEKSVETGDVSRMTALIVVFIFSVIVLICGVKVLKSISV